MKAITVLGSVITEQTAADYLARLAKLIYGLLDIYSSTVFDEQAERIVSAGFLDWDQVEEIEISACKALA